MEKPDVKKFDLLLKEVEAIVGTELPTNSKLSAICELLASNVPYFNWVGFYFVDKLNKQELVIGPFVGKHTEHTKIPFGGGICGQVAEAKRTFVIQDVSKEDNYLACSKEVKSEIVVPILKDGQLLAELDIDSHSFSPFSEADQKFLEDICKMLSELSFS